MEGDQTKKINPSNNGTPVNNQTTVSATNSTPQQPAATPASIPTPSAAQGGNSVAFKSADIGVKTVRKEDPFAPQNQRRAEKKQQAKQDRKKFYLIGGIVIAVAIIALVIWGLVVIFGSKGQGGDNSTDVSEYEPEPGRTISTAVEDVSSLAQDAFQDGGDNLEAAQEIFDSAIQESASSSATSAQQSAESQSRINQLQIAKVMFYINNGYYNEVINTEGEVEPGTMTAEQRTAYYNMLYLAYVENGNYPDKVEEYSKLMYEAAREAGGAGAGEGE